MTAILLICIGIVLSPFHSKDATTPQIGANTSHINGSNLQRNNQPHRESSADSESAASSIDPATKSGAQVMYSRDQNTMANQQAGRRVVSVEIEPLIVGDTGDFAIQAMPCLSNTTHVDPNTTLRACSELQLPGVTSLHGADYDSIETPKKDSIWNYAGVYLNATFTPRSFSGLNARLSANGFPSIKSALFGGGLSYEFARPGRDSAAPISFPVFLYPSTPKYAPSISVEWVILPELSSADGQRRISYSSWTITANNNVFLHTGKLSRALLVFGFGVNFSSVTLGLSRNFDDVLSANSGSPVSLSRASALLRTALRYDYTFASLQLGVTAGYDFALDKANWRMRSSLQFDPGISVESGPDDGIGGLYLGVTMTLRGWESMMPSR